MKNTFKMSTWIYELIVIVFTTALIIGFYKANTSEKIVAKKVRTGHVLKAQRQIADTIRNYEF